MNLGQSFQSNLNTKLTKNVGSADFAKLPCNYSRTSRVNRKCMCGGECRKSIVVYKVECKDCKMCYIQNTQQKMKLRISQHLDEVCNLASKRKTSDSFAKTLCDTSTRPKYSTNYCIGAQES